MKKLILSLLLIGFGMSAKLYAQADLDVVNNSGLLPNIRYRVVDACFTTCPTSLTAWTASSLGSYTITTGASCGQVVYSVEVDFGCGTFIAVVVDGCGGTATLANATDCFSNPRQVLFSPATISLSGSGGGTNAVVTIN